MQSTIYWCRQCNVPLYGNRCSRCGMEAKKLTTDVRPVFPEERLLIEIILQKPFEFLKNQSGMERETIILWTEKRLLFL